MSQLGGNRFLLTLFTRIVILAMAAVSLNLILGYGGMMSFGHAAYLGIGGYAVGMLAHEGISSGFVQWPVALVGLRAVRAGDRRAVAAHARRLLHHDHAWPLRRWPITSSSGWRATAATTASPSTSAASSWRRSICRTRRSSIIVCLALLFGSIYLVWRLVNSRFGMVIQGSRSNDMRMRAIGFPTYRYKLVCFVIAGTLCGLAGRAAWPITPTSSARR